MKGFFLVHFLIYLFSCATHSQGGGKEFIVNEKLKNKFSDGPLPGVRGGPDRVYLNGVLVDSTYIKSDIHFVYNASIRDINGNHLPFDTCTSFFDGDTLMFVFKEMNEPSSDKIEVRIINKTYSIIFTLNNSNEGIIASNESLILNSDLGIRKRVVLGDIAFLVNDKVNNKQYSFKGSFICKVE